MAEVDFASPIEVIIVDWLILIIFWPFGNLNKKGYNQPEENMHISKDD
jgi:hypothetical protein